jgi:hypothetical protein
LTSALVGGELLVSRPQWLYPQGNGPQYPLDRSLFGPQRQPGRFPGLELRPFGRAAPSQSPYRPRSLSHTCSSVPTDSIVLSVATLSCGNATLRRFEDILRRLLYYALLAQIVQTGNPQDRPTDRPNAAGRRS